MALPVLIIGRSGSGKTYSLKNFKPEEVGVISVEKARVLRALIEKAAASCTDILFV